MRRCVNRMGYLLMRRLWLLLILLCGSGGTMEARTWYVAAEGKSGELPPCETCNDCGTRYPHSETGAGRGEGTMQRPWSLEWALSNPPDIADPQFDRCFPDRCRRLIQPGDIVELRGGTYAGYYTSAFEGPLEVRHIPAAYTCYLEGSEGLPIIVRAEKGGKVSLDMTGRTIALRLQQLEYVPVLSKVPNPLYKKHRDQRNPWRYMGRIGQLPNPPPPPEDPLMARMIGSVLSNAGLVITKPYITVQDLEICNHTTQRFSYDRGNKPLFRENLLKGSPPDELHPMDIREGVTVNARGVRLIGLHIHDMLGDGIDAYDAATGIEISSCIIHNNGWNCPNRPNGQGIYTQNTSEVPRLFRQNVIYNNAQNGLKFYSGSKPIVRNYNLIGNYAMNNGSMFVSYNIDREIVTDGELSPAPRWMTWDNIYIGNTAAEKFTLRGNHFILTEARYPMKYPAKLLFHNRTHYHDSDYYLYRTSNFHIGANEEEACTDFIIDSNHSFGGGYGFTLTSLWGLSFTRNIIEAQYEGVNVYQVNKQMPCPYTVPEAGSKFYPGINVWAGNVIYPLTGLGTPKKALVRFCYPGNCLRQCGNNCTPECSSGFYCRRDTLVKRYVAGTNPEVAVAAAPPLEEVLIQRDEVHAGRYFVYIYNWKASPKVRLNLARYVISGHRFRLLNALKPDESIKGLPAVYTEPFQLDLSQLGIAPAIGEPLRPSDPNPNYMVKSIGGSGKYACLVLELE